MLKYPIETPQLLMLLKFILTLLKVVIPLITRLEVHGDRDKLQRGNQIIVSNHIGILEGLLVYYFVDRDDAIVLVAEKHKDHWFTRELARQVDAIFVDRYNADFNATRKVLKRLQEGDVMVIAPEGTRSPDGSLQEGRLGVSYLASKTGVPILPVAVTGTEDQVVKSKLLRLQRVPVVVRIGDPFKLPPAHGSQRREKLQEYTDEIMCRIAALLPSEKRGVYAQNPRVEELLRSS
jgi:1-acyl-sn-glycerol-3-phosphate acyltransferase